LLADASGVGSYVTSSPDKFATTNVARSDPRYRDMMADRIIHVEMLRREASEV
jgi:hypothetical protein